MFSFRRVSLVLSLALVLVVALSAFVPQAFAGGGGGSGVVTIDLPKTAQANQMIQAKVNFTNTSGREIPYTGVIHLLPNSVRLLSADGKLDDQLCAENCAYFVSGRLKANQTHVYVFEVKAPATVGNSYNFADATLIAPISSQGVFAFFANLTVTAPPTATKVSTATPTYPPMPKKPISATRTPTATATRTAIPTIVPTRTPVPQGCTPINFVETHTAGTDVLLSGAWWLNVSASPQWSSVEFDTAKLRILLHFNVESGTVYIKDGPLPNSKTCAVIPFGAATTTPTSTQPASAGLNNRTATPTQVNVSGGMSNNSTSTPMTTAIVRRAI